MEKASGNRQNKQTQNNVSFSIITKTNNFLSEPLKVSYALVCYFNLIFFSKTSSDLNKDCQEQKHFNMIYYAAIVKHTMSNREILTVKLTQ